MFAAEVNRRRMRIPVRIDSGIPVSEITILRSVKNDFIIYFKY
jgi:hypothetical protein